MNLTYRINLLAFCVLSCFFSLKVWGFGFFLVKFWTEDVIINLKFILYKMMFILTELKKNFFQTCTLYFMDLLSKELQKIFCPHLILPIFQLAEVIANEVVECRSLSDLYRLRFVSFIYFK